MYIYNIPYIEDDSLYTEVIYSNEKKDIAELLVEFLDTIQHGYLDDNFEEEPLDFLLDVAVNDYHMAHITIHYIKENGEVVTGMYAVKDIYHSYEHCLDTLDYLKTVDEIILSTEIHYDKDIHSDWVNFLWDGIETHLFSYATIEAKKENEAEKEEEIYSDFALPNELYIDKPLQNEEQLVDLFKQWATALGIDITHKKIRLAEEKDYQKRPRLENLERTVQRLKEEPYTIPMHLAFLEKKEVPTFEQMVEYLKKESPETIACVLEKFSDNYIIRVLQALEDEDKLIEVAQKFPSVPTLTFEERRRFFDIFEYEESFALSRIKVLQSRYSNFQQVVLKPDKNTQEQDDTNEYLAWEWMLKQNR